MLSPAQGKTKFFLSTSCIFGFAQDRMRLGTVKMENFVFIFPLRSAFTIFGFAQDRMRLGKAKSENFVFSLGFALGFHYLCKQ